MPRRIAAKTRKYRRPTGQELVICREGKFSLGDYYTATELEDLLPLARLRVIGVFRHAKQTVRRNSTKYEHRVDRVSLRRPPQRTKLVTTDNYICGVGPKLSELAHEIQRHIRNHVITCAYLRQSGRFDDVLELSPTLISKFIAHLEEKLVLRELEFLLDEGDVWFEQSHGGIWQLRQSVIDEHLDRRDALRRELPFNQRPEHGRVRSQRKRSETPSGTSTGMTKRSPAVRRASW